MKRLQRYHFNDVENQFLRKGLKIASKLLPDRKLPAGMKPYGGSTWLKLTYSCVKYVLDFIDSNPRFVNFYKFSLITDEIFFQTIILNSPYAPKVINSELTYTDWSAQGSNPEILGVEDFEKIAKCDSLFARKFDTNYDSEILTLIDKKLLNRG